MAGRGRGRGKPSMSINPEQFGFAKGEPIQLPPVLQPPGKYPALDYKPPPFQLSVELSYLLQLKRDYEEVMRESPNNVQAILVKKDIERYSDRYQDMMADKSTYEQRYDWSRIPSELKRVGKKRKTRAKKEIEAKKRKVDVEKKLQELEKKENTQPSDAEEDDKDEDNDDEKDADETVEDEEAEVDEEMDDGTDYMNNYFDNGEGYEDEEDNLDDGPIY